LLMNSGRFSTAIRRRRPASRSEGKPLIWLLGAEPMDSV
jgi:hypothetical protein